MEEWLSGRKAEKGVPNYKRSGLKLKSVATPGVMEKLINK